MPCFKAFRSDENKCNGWLENGIYKAVSKEMAMAHSSYARAAGIQSEISKVTVTRVASSEVECKRQTNVYRKDMIITVNNIAREQRILRKSMMKYTKKKHQHRLEKEKREKLRLEKEQREREEFEKWEKIHALLNIDNVSKAEVMDETSNDENDKEHEENCQIISDENNNETLKTNRTSKKCNEKEDLNPFDVLPAITEVENEQESTQERENEEDIEVQKTETLSPSIDLKQSIGDLPSSLLTLTLRPIKPKKQIVSFSDIIKLKHSHNTNKLFDMVHVLAEKHGVNESVEKRRAERKNSRIPRGSTDAVISESLRKAASIIYPMNFGYGDHASNNKEKFDFYGENLPPEPKGIPQEQNQIETTSPKISRNLKRNKTVSGFNEEMKKLRREDMLRNGMVEEGRKFTNISTRSSSSKFLPSINSTKSSPKSSRSNSVSWTEAFGLLKIVHSIE